MTGMTQGAAQADQFRCDNCGGVLLYDPKSRGLLCKHCKAAAAPSRLAPMPGYQVREIPLEQGLSRPPLGLGVQLEGIECKECGATVNMQPGERSTTCVYCASPTVVTVNRCDSTITPESLIPFLVPPDTASENFKKWLSGLWFRPSDLSKLAKLEQIYGVYVPYWTFDATVHSSWTAERGHHYYETETYTEEVNGETVTKTRQVQHTRWESAWGQRTDSFDDVLVCASKGVPEKLADKLCTFTTSQLVPYSPGYLCGWRAESYAIDLPTAWKKGQSIMESEQYSRCSGDVGGDTHRGLSVSNSFNHETFKHVLLPVFVAAYRYKEKPYQVLVNGQTGEVVGNAPYSFWKILLLILFIIGVIAGLVWLTGKNNQDPPRPHSASSMQATSKSTSASTTTTNPTATASPQPTAKPSARPPTKR
jgi:hypothetical protein